MGQEMPEIELYEKKKIHQRLVEWAREQDVTLGDRTILAIGSFASWVAFNAAVHNEAALITTAIFGIGGQIFYGKDIIGSSKRTLMSVMVPQDAEKVREHVTRAVEAVVATEAPYRAQSPRAKMLRLKYMFNPDQAPEGLFDRVGLQRVLPAASPIVEAGPVPVDDGLPAVFPRYRADETLRIGKAIDKDALASMISACLKDQRCRLDVPGQRFEPHVDALFGKGMILAAVQGSGKSMLNALVVEQAGACDVPVILLDHKGEYTSITELSHLSGMIAGSPDAKKKSDKMGVPFYELTLGNVDEFVATVISEHRQAVIPLPSYGESWIARAEIVGEVGQALMRYSARQRAEDKSVLPCLVFLDEAQLYIPENRQLLPPEARDKESAKILNNLQNAYFALVSNGRSNGYTMCFATQSLTYIAKWAIKSCQIKIFMRHVEHNDLETISECLNLSAKGGLVRREDMETMPPGVGVVCGFTPRPVVVRFDTRESRDESETPSIARLRANRASSLARAEQSPRGDSQRLQAEFSNDQMEAIHSLVGKAVETAILSMRSGNENSVCPISDQNRFPFPNTEIKTQQSEVNVEAIGNGFEASGNAPSGNVSNARSSSDFSDLGVSAETVRLIKNMKKGGHSDRSISEVVELTGRKYSTYREIVRRLVD